MNEFIVAAKAATPTTSAAGLSLSAIFTAIAAFFGKIPILLVLFMAAVVLDYITGWVKAKYFLKDWNSKTGLQGIIKKLMYFVMIGTAFLIGYGIKEIGESAGVNLEFALLIGWYVTAVMLINEFTSILENLYVIMPEKVPVWLIKTLKVADEKLDHKINDIVCKNQNCNTCELKNRCNLKKEETNGD
jgi:toxin secretion/phage lysis holin